MQLCAAWSDLESDSLDSQPADGPHAKAANLAKGEIATGFRALASLARTSSFPSWKHGNEENRRLNRRPPRAFPQPFFCDFAMSVCMSAVARCTTRPPKGSAARSFMGA